MKKRTSATVDLVRGAISGGVATWVMDQVTTAMLSAQAPEVTEREEAVRPNGKGAVTNLVDRVSAATGTELTPEQRSRLEQGIHYGLGVAPGALYALLRRRAPLVGAAGGLLYGFLLWALNDEYANTALGLAAPPEAYPAETHLRGLVGHLVLGALTDSGVDALGG